MLLTWYIVSKWISFISAYRLLQRINGSVTSTWHNKADSFCATTPVQGYQYQAIGSDADILSMPWAKAQNLVLRAYLCILIVARFINQQKADGLVSIVLCGKNANRII